MTKKRSMQASKSATPTAKPKARRPGRAASTSPGDNPLLAPWTTPFDDAAVRCNIGSSTSCRPSTAALPSTARRSRPSPATRRRRRSPTPSTPWSGPGDALDRVSAVFFNLAATDTNDEIQAIERALAPRFAKHGMRIYQDETLFAPRRCPVQEAQEARAERGAGARAGALSPRLRQVRRRARRPAPRSAWRRSPRACPCSAPSSARTCWPTSRRS